MTSAAELACTLCVCVLPTSVGWIPLQIWSLWLPLPLHLGLDLKRCLHNRGLGDFFDLATFFWFHLWHLADIFIQYDFSSFIQVSTGQGLSCGSARIWTCKLLRPVAYALSYHCPLFTLVWEKCHYPPCSCAVCHGRLCVFSLFLVLIPFHLTVKSQESLNIDLMTIEQHVKTVVWPLPSGREVLSSGNDLICSDEFTSTTKPNQAFFLLPD